MISAALSSSELRYRRLFEAAHDGILIVNPETRQIIDVNPFLMNFLGYSYDEFVGKELFEIGLLKDEAASQAAFRELQATGYIRYEDLPLKTKDGRCVDVEFVSNIYNEGGQKVIQCNVRDITARKKSEKALHDAQKKISQNAAELAATVRLRTAELRRSNMQLETFVYSIAHDLRAPLRTMQGFAQLLVQKHAAGLDEQGRDYARFIDTAAQTMDCLLTDLLEFSQISQQEIELGAVPLESVMREVLFSCEKMIRESRARIENISPWPVVLAHATILRQVLVNLLSNALKFVSSEAPFVRIWSEERPDEIIRVWVEDNGIGISPEFHERIFQVFQRLHTKEYAGTGIGLAIVRKGMERMNGRVGVISTSGKGSRFWIELSKASDATIDLPAKVQMT